MALSCGCWQTNASWAANETTAAVPAARIELGTLGYVGLSAGARQSGASNASVDFLDEQHILLTFNPKKLFRRLPDCPPSHADRLIHAVVMEVPSGKVVREADWYLHDLRRYVWNLGNGRVLLRRLNRLYEVNSNLEERMLLDSPADLLWVSVTPDGKQILVETKAEPDAKEAKSKGDKRGKIERVKVAFLDSTSMVVHRTIEVRGTIKLEATSSGFADVRKVGSNWLVEFGSTNLSRVKSLAPPALLYTSGNTVAIGRCSVSRKGYNVSVFTVTGTFLWRQHWEDCRFAPLARDSEDGSRFASGTVTVRAVEENAAESGGTEVAKEGLVQHIQVADTATGQPVLSLTVEPAILDGQNFSLSPEGNRLAVIAGTTVDVYSLPEMSAEDRAKWVAVRADTPNLNAPPAQPMKPGEEPVYSASADEPLSDTQPASPAAGFTNEVGSEKPASAAVTHAEDKSDLTPTLTIRTGTQVVAVDVVVTDSGGHLVRGLRQSDFQVLEDGKPQTVRFFKEYTEAQQAEAAPVPAKVPLPPNVFSNSTLPVDQGAVTVVLLDLLNTPMEDQTYGQDQLIKFLKEKPSDAKFALCILGDRLQMIQGFTENKATLLAAAKGKKASQRQRPLHESDAVPPITKEATGLTSKFQPSLDSFANMISLQQSEARQIDADQRMIVTVDAFAHLARYLSGIPGRKNLVWLSGSFILGIYPDSNGQNPFLGTRHYGDNLKKVANLLGEAHVAVYPVDVKGLEANPLFSAANDNLVSPLATPGRFIPRAGSAVGGTILSSGGRPDNPNLGLSTDVMEDQLQQFELAQIDEHATMSDLATHTGGKAFFNTNGIAEAIRTAAEQGSNYYALSYTPANKKYDGSFRKVKVTIAGKKYHLAHRSGYYAMDPFAPVRPSKDMSSTLARAAMQAGSPQSRQIVFGARVVPMGKPQVVQDSPSSVKPTKKHKDEQAPLEIQRYAIDHAVTFSDLRFAPSADGVYHDMLNFLITTFDADGKLIASQVAQTSANFKPEVMKEVMAGGLRMHQEIDVPVKSVAMRLGVEDVSNGHIGTLEIPLPVPPPPKPQEQTRRALPAVEPD
jgi:VWFA-related protein